MFLTFSEVKRLSSNVKIVLVHFGRSKASKVGFNGRQTKSGSQSSRKQKTQTTGKAAQTTASCTNNSKLHNRISKSSKNSSENSKGATEPPRPNRRVLIGVFSWNFGFSRLFLRYRQISQLVVFGEFIVKFFLTFWKFKKGLRLAFQWSAIWKHPQQQSSSSSKSCSNTNSKKNSTQQETKQHKKKQLKKYFRKVKAARVCLHSHNNKEARNAGGVGLPYSLGQYVLVPAIIVVLERLQHCM